MATSEDQREKGSGACPECGAGRTIAQRYCVSCGARLGLLPREIAARISRLGGGATAAGAAALQAAKPERYDGWPFARSEFMPSPRTIAAAVVAMLGLGVLLGSVTEQVAMSAGLSTIVVESPSAPPEPATHASAQVVEAPVREAPAEPAPAPPPASGPSEPPPAEEPTYEEPTGEAPVIDEELPAGMPEIKHVFVIMLGENGFEEAFGGSSQSKYLGTELPAQGELLENYFAVAKGELANQIALLSGQGPTPATEAECPEYTDVSPGTESAEGQVEGEGCVYPATTKSLPAQLAEAKLGWRAYVEESEDGPAVGQPGTCRHPEPGSADPNQAPTAGDRYVTWRNPFVYFHSILDGAECAEADVGIQQLSEDLKLKPEEFPALAYIVPDACDRGAEAPCEEGRQAGPSAAEEFLRMVVPEIKESLAYKDGGMIVITSAEARQGGEAPDSSGCCIAPAYPNLLPPATAEPASGPVFENGGGGRVGLLIISPYVEPGTTSETYFNHFSLLATIEELFGLEKIGYAAEPAVTGFDESIFNAAN